MRERRLDEHGDLVRRLVEESLELAHAVGDAFGWRGDVGGETRAWSADPVLGGPELPGLLLSPASTGEQLAVDLADQPIRERETFPKASEPVLQCPHAAGHVFDVSQGHAGGFVELEEQQIREG